MSTPSEIETWEGTWGGERISAYLEKYRHEEKYCPCCGHEDGMESFLLPESEWYWRSRIIRMDLMPRLEDDGSRLFELIKKLPKGEIDASTAVIDWMADE